MASSRLNTHPTTTNSPAFSFRGRSAPAKPNRNPGPGNYEPASNFVKPKTGGYSFGRSSRDRKLAEASPGPGNYEINARPKTSCKFGSEKRPASVAHRIRTPGAGTYQIPGKEVEGPRYTMIPRYERRIGSAVPGPGEYSVSEEVTSKTLPRPIFGKDTNRLKWWNAPTPGPGRY
jgi:hypothetical protein